VTTDPQIQGRTVATGAYLASVAVSALGDGFRYAALPLLLTLYGLSPAVLGLLLMAGTVPFLLVGLVGGAVVDRVDRIQVLRATELIRFAVVLGFAGLLLADAPQPVVVTAAFAVAFVMGAGEAFAFPAIFAITPTVVDEDGLARFNGWLTAAQTIGRDLLGPLVGAAMVVSLSPGPFLIDALTFAGSWLLLGVLGRHHAAERPPSRPVNSVRADIADGFRWLRGQPTLIRVAVASALVNLGNMGFLATEALYAVRELGAPAWGYGALMAAASVGGVLAALLIGKLTARSPSVGTVALACLVIATGMAVLALAGGLVPALGGALCTGAGYAIYNVTVTTLRQRLTPAERRGRADSFHRTVAWGVLPIGSLVGGLVAELAGLRAPATLAAAAALLAAFWLLTASTRPATVASSR
jgi:MFS family permease